MGDEEAPGLPILADEVEAQSVENGDGHCDDHHQHEEPILRMIDFSCFLAIKVPKYFKKIPRIPKEQGDGSCLSQAGPINVVAGKEGCHVEHHLCNP